LLFKRWVAIIVAVIFFVLAFLILYEQKVTFGLWFQPSDLHHETFAIAFAALALGVLIGSAITETPKAKRGFT
jgi:divalent metal cation (Fe/Co/Zn/Cd) transporter